MPIQEVFGDVAQGPAEQPAVRTVRRKGILCAGRIELGSGRPGDGFARVQDRLKLGHARRQGRLSLPREPPRLLQHTQGLRELVRIEVGLAGVDVGGPGPDKVARGLQRLGEQRAHLGKRLEGAVPAVALGRGLERVVELKERTVDLARPPPHFLLGEDGAQHNVMALDAGEVVDGVGARLTPE